MPGSDRAFAKIVLYCEPTANYVGGKERGIGVTVLSACIVAVGVACFALSACGAARAWQLDVPPCVAEINAGASAESFEVSATADASVHGARLQLVFHRDPVYPSGTLVVRAAGVDTVKRVRLPRSLRHPDTVEVDVSSGVYTIEFGSICLALKLTERTITTWHYYPNVWLQFSPE